MKSRHTLLILSLLLIIVALGRSYSSYLSPASVKEPVIIRNDLKVLLYTKNMCKYCILAKELLDKNYIPYETISLENNIDLYKKLIDRTGQQTVPYIYINDKFIGGYDALEELKESGKLYYEDQIN